jgi:hypothetical protein
MCIELLPPGGYPTAVNKIYHIISYLYASAKYKLITEIFRSFGGTECTYDIGAAFHHNFKSEILTN